LATFQTEIYETQIAHAIIQSINVIFVRSKSVEPATLPRDGMIQPQNRTPSLGQHLRNDRVSQSGSNNEKIVWPKKHTLKGCSQGMKRLAKNEVN
jgi:hypothetical protein